MQALQKIVGGDQARAQSLATRTEENIYENTVTRAQWGHHMSSKINSILAKNNQAPYAGVVDARYQGYGGAAPAPGTASAAAQAPANPGGYYDAQAGAYPPQAAAAPPQQAQYAQQYDPQYRVQGYPAQQQPQYGAAPQAQAAPRTHQHQHQQQQQGVPQGAPAQQAGPGAYPGAYGATKQQYAGVQYAPQAQYPHLPVQQAPPPQQVQQAAPQYQVTATQYQPGPQPQYLPQKSDYPPSTLPQYSAQQSQQASRPPPMPLPATRAAATEAGTGGGPSPVAAYRQLQAIARRELLKDAKALVARIDSVAASRSGAHSSSATMRETLALMEGPGLPDPDIDGAAVEALRKRLADMKQYRLAAAVGDMDRSGGPVAARCVASAQRVRERTGAGGGGSVGGAGAGTIRDGLPVAAAIVRVPAGAGRVFRVVDGAAGGHAGAIPPATDGAAASGADAATTEPGMAPVAPSPDPDLRWADTLCAEAQAAARGTARLRVLGAAANGAALVACEPAGEGAGRWATLRLRLEPGASSPPTPLDQQPAIMASAVLTPLVTRLLRSFIRSSAESRGSTLKVSFSSRGTLLLHNLELDLDALVPGLRVHKALARALEITIPWAGLSSQPIQVVLTAVDIEVGPEPASADAGPETKAQQTNLASQAPHEGGRGPGWLGGALQGWLLRTLCNMQVTLKHVSLAWVGADGAVAARCAFQSLEFYTDPSLVADMEVPEAWLGKCLSLTNLSFSMREASGGVLGPLLVLPHASLTLSSPINAFIEDWDEERCGDDPLLTELVLELQDPTLSLTDGQLCTLRTLCSECAAAFEPRGESVLEREDSQPPARTLLREQSLSDGSREENLGLPDAASVGSLEAASILAAWAQVAARVASRVKASLTMQAIHACFGVSAVRPAAAAQPAPAPAPGDVVLRMGQGGGAAAAHPDGTAGPVWDEVLALRPPQGSENEIRGQRGAAVRAHFQSLSGDGAAPAGREASKEARGTSLTLEAGRLLLAGSPTALAALGRVAAALRGEAPAPSGGGGCGARSDGNGRADTALSDEWPDAEVPRDAAHGNTAIWPCTGGSLALSQVQLVWGLPAAWILLESSCLQVNIGGDEDADGRLGDAPSQAAAKTNLKAASSQLPVMRLEVPVTRLCVVPRLREPCADSAGSGAESLDASPSLLTSALVLEACVRGMHLVSAATSPLLLTASAAQLAALAGNHPDEVYMVPGKNVLADGAQHTTTHSFPLSVWDRPWLETLQLQLDAARLEAVESDSNTGAGALGSLPTQHRLQLRSAGITATLAEGLGALEARLSGGIALEMPGRALAAPAAADGSIRGEAGAGDGSAAGQTSGASGAGSSYHEPGSTWSVAVPASSLVLSGPPGIEGGTQAQLLTLGPGRVRCNRDGALAVESSLHLGLFELELQPEGSGLQGVRLAAQACCVGWGAGTEVTLGRLAADLDLGAAEPHRALLRVAAHSSGAPALRLLASSDWEHSGLGVHLGGVDVALTRAALTACRGWAEALAPVDDPPPLPASASHLRVSCDRLDLSLSTTAGFQEQEGGTDGRCDALPSKLNACTVRFQSDKLAVTLVSTPASENRPWMPAHTSVSQADATVLASQLTLSYPGTRPGQRHMALLLAPTDLRLEAGVWPLGPRAVQVHAGDLTCALSWRDLEVLASMARALGRGGEGAMEAGRSGDEPAGGSEDMVPSKRDGDPAASGSGSSAADSLDDLTAGQVAVAACAGREILPSQIQGWSVEMEDATAQHHLLWRYPRPRRVACLTFRAQASHVVHAAFGLTAYDPGLPAQSEESKNAIPLRLEALGDDDGCSWRIIAAQPALPAQCHQLCWRGPLSPHALLPSLRINPLGIDSVDPLPPLSAQTSLALRAGRLAVALHEYGPEGRPPLTSIYASGLEAGWHAFPDGAWAARLGGEPDAALPLDVCELPLSCEAPQQGRTSLHVSATTALRVNAWQWTPSALSRLSGLRRALPPALVLTNATPVAVVVRQAGAEGAHLLGSGEEAPFAWPLPPAVVPGARRRLQLAAAGAAYHKGAAPAPGPETARWSEPVDTVTWTLVGLLEGGVAVEQAGAEAGRGGPWLRIDPGSSRGAILTLGAAGPSPSLRVWLGGGRREALDLTGSDDGEDRGSQVLLPDARVQPQPPPPELAAACAPVGALLAGVRCRGGVGGVTLAAPARLRNGLGVPVRVRPVGGPKGHRGDAVRVLDPGASCDLAVVPVGGVACVVESAASDPQPPGGAGPGSAGGEQDRGAPALVATPSLALVFPPLLPSAGGPQPVAPSGSPLRTPPSMGGFRSGGATPAFVPPPGFAARVHLGSTPSSPPAPAPCQLATTCAPGPLGVAALVVTLLPRFFLHNLLGAEAAAWGCGLGDGSAAAAASAGIVRPGAPFLHPSASAVLACDSDDPPESDAPAPPLGALQIVVRGPGGLVCRSEAVSLAEAGGERKGPWTRRLVLTSDTDGAGATAPALELHVLLSLWREDHHGAAVVWHASLAPALHVSNASEEALEVQAEGAVVDFSAGGSGDGRAGPWQRCLAPGETQALLLGAPRTPGGGDGFFGPRLRFARSAPHGPLWGPAICASHALGRQRMHLLGACDEAGGEGARAPLMASWRVVEVGNRSHLIVFRDRQPPGVLCNATSETLEVGIFLAPSESKAGHSRPSLPHTVFQIPPGEEVEAELLPHWLARPGELRAGSGQGPLSPRRDAAATGPSGTAWDDSEDEDAFLDCLQARAESGDPWAHPLLLRPGRHELARGLTVDVARRCAGLRVAFCSAPASLPPKAPPCQRLHADLALAGLELCLWDDERGLLAPPPRRCEGADSRHSAGREVAALALRGLRLRADLAPCLRGEGVEVAADLACRALQLDALAGEGRTMPVLRTAPVRSLTRAYDAGRGSGNLGGGTASASLRDAPWAHICVRHVPGAPPLAPSFRNAWVQDARLALPPLAAAVDDGVVAFARRVLGSLEAGEAEHGDASLGFEDSTTPMSPSGALRRALTAEAAGAAASRLYVASCMVQPISVLLDVHLAAGTAGIPVALDTTSAPLSFSALAMRDALFRPHVLARGLAAHALAEALLGAPRMLGSLALLLNPAGLIGQRL
ncbi:hypothetical protein F751_0723 [Auxenochlorella protothecoides]|uniref:Uncharacterized protein n=1 Tax=Auxenochlorella protothecoides TaxID=3075 RepID=A0A087SM37_AUXPR|nr:hypothetical protein F751_0723 [Auxenochlorella protothecoides]KFM26791.1 hypothetical protein F751_0723 [Auxenochlorella protothecoides]